LNKKDLRIYFADFWPNFNIYDNYFLNLLSMKYNVIIDDVMPEVLFHSVDYAKQSNHLKFNNDFTKKIFFTGENIEPDFSQTDYSLSFISNTEKNNYRLPLWVTYIDWFDSKKNKNRDPSFLIPKKKLLNQKKNFSAKPMFCSFIASKPIGKRMEFVPKLNESKKVHSLGRLYSNSYLRAFGRGDSREKVSIMKLFKFNICFESEHSPGYVTEKILHSFYANSIPIYWGDDFVKKDFNQNAFLFYDDFNTQEEIIDRILTINSSSTLYKKYTEQPVFEDNSYPEFTLPDNVLSFISEKIEE